jgi:hypothetical protein
MPTVILLPSETDYSRFNSRAREKHMLTDSVQPYNKPIIDLACSVCTVKYQTSVFCMDLAPSSLGFQSLENMTANFVYVCSITCGIVTIFGLKMVQNMQNSQGYYFPNFTTFRNQILQLYIDPYYYFQLYRSILLLPTI